MGLDPFLFWIQVKSGPYSYTLRSENAKQIHKINKIYSKPISKFAQRNHKNVIFNNTLIVITGIMGLPAPIKIKEKIVYKMRNPSTKTRISNDEEDSLHALHLQEVLQSKGRQWSSRASPTHFYLAHGHNELGIISY